MEILTLLREKWEMSIWRFLINVSVTVYGTVLRHMQVYYRISRCVTVYATVLQYMRLFYSICGCVTVYAAVFIYHDACEEIDKIVGTSMTRDL